MEEQYSEHIAHRIEEEHANLRLLMASVSKSFASPPVDDFVDWKLELVWELRDFRNVLVKHFDLEEDGGFMADVVDTAPHEKRKVDQLHSEHDEFLEELESITAALKLMYEPSGMHLLGERLSKLNSGLHDHEALERDLIGFVYSQDLGLGD